jgi:acyl carrier protein
MERSVAGRKMSDAVAKGGEAANSRERTGMTNELTVRERILAMLRQRVPCSAATVDEAARLEDIGLTSLDVVEIIFQIEEALQIDIPYFVPDADVRRSSERGLKIETVGDILIAVQRIVARGHRPAY